MVCFVWLLLGACGQSWLVFYPVIVMCLWMVTITCLCLVIWLPLMRAVSYVNVFCMLLWHCFLVLKLWWLLFYVHFVTITKCVSLTLDNCDSAAYTHCTYIDTLIKEAVEKDLVDQWIMTK